MNIYKAKKKTSIKEVFQPILYEEDLETRKEEARRGLASIRSIWPNNLAKRG